MSPVASMIWASDRIALDEDVGAGLVAERRIHRQDKPASDEDPLHFPLPFRDCATTWTISATPT